MSNGGLERVENKTGSIPEGPLNPEDAELAGSPYRETPEPATPADGYRNTADSYTDLDGSEWPICAS